MMMKSLKSFRLSLSLVLVAGLGLGVAQEVATPAVLKSGPAVGGSVAAYHPLLCNGKSVGQRWCMVCTERSRGNGMVIVFARELNAQLKTLISAVEEAATKHEKTGGIVTLLSTKGKTAGEVEALTGKEVRFLDDAEKGKFAELKKLATELKLTKTSLNIFSEVGPGGYALSPDAAVTVLVADASGSVTLNLAMKKSEVNEAKVKAAIASINAVLAKK